MPGRKAKKVSIEKTGKGKPTESKRVPKPGIKLFDNGKTYYTPREKRELLYRLISKAKREGQSFQFLEFIKFSRSF